MLRRFLNLFRRQGTDDQPAAAPAPRNYAQERDDRHQSGLSEEDRAWQEASLRRDGANQAQDQSPPGNG
jgi:hypothetical protein